MLSINKRSQKALFKIYLYMYVISIFIMQFTRNSQINGGTKNGVNLNNQFGGTLYLAVMLITVMVNIFLLLDSSKFNFNNWHLLVGIGVLLLYSIRIFSNYQVIDSYYLMIAMLIINSNLIVFNIVKFLKVNFWVHFDVVAAIVLASFLHLFPASNSTVLYRHGVPRYTLGFVNANALALSTLIAVLSFIIYIHFIKMNNKWNKYISVAVSLLLLLFIAHISQSREVQAAGYFLIILLIFYKNPILHRVPNLLLVPSLILTFLSSIYVTLFMSHNSFFVYLNKLLSYRPLYIYESFQLYPARFLGYKSTPLLKYINLGHAMDNMYMNILFNCGILGLLIFVILLFKSCCILLKNHDQIISIALISLFVAYLSANCYQLCSIYIIIFALNSYYSIEPKLKNAKKYKRNKVSYYED